MLRMRKRMPIMIAYHVYVAAGLLIGCFHQLEVLFIKLISMFWCVADRINNNALPSITTTRTITVMMMMMMMVMTVIRALLIGGYLFKFISCF